MGLQQGPLNCINKIEANTDQTKSISKKILLSYISVYFKVICLRFVGFSFNYKEAPGTFRFLTALRSRRVTLWTLHINRLRLWICCGVKTQDSLFARQKSNCSRVSPVGQDLCDDLFRSVTTNQSIFIPLTGWIYILPCAEATSRHCPLKWNANANHQTNFHFLIVN